jgi:hypothetical protein
MPAVDAKQSTSSTGTDEMATRSGFDLISALTDDDATTTQSNCRAVKIEFLETDAGLVATFCS